MGLIRRVLGVPVAFVGAGGIAVFLISLSDGMREVMRADGGSCAGGGAYLVPQRCSSGDIRLVLFGIIGTLACTVLFAGASAALGTSGLAAVLLAWAALFGKLGWNFVSLGMRPPTGSGTVTGWLISGLIFWVLALSGLIPTLVMAAGWLRKGGRPDPVSIGVRPLVSVAVRSGSDDGPHGGFRHGGFRYGGDRDLPPTGLAVLQPGGFGGLHPVSGAIGGNGPAGGRAPQSWPDSIMSAGVWLVTSAAGAAAGLGLAATLVTSMR